MKKNIKEVMLVLITVIVVSLVSVSAAVHFNSENISFEPKDTNWNVSSTSSALNDLYDTSNTKITNFKTTIAQAITDMGVTTAEDADAETMANNIKNISSLESNTRIYIEVESTAQALQSGSWASCGTENIIEKGDFTKKLVYAGYSQTNYDSNKGLYKEYTISHDCELEISWDYTISHANCSFEIYHNGVPLINKGSNLSGSGKSNVNVSKNDIIKIYTNAGGNQWITKGNYKIQEL
ncbi:MAG: hypothetical protein ACI31M_01425 [Bacilli bacterium]